ncbi:MAG: GYD domain-containing protein [Pedosphaera sp.]|nr:GYD domain-containing protein [Pedosphaera sp.]
MPRYIALLKFTEQGANNIKKSTARAHNFDKLAAKSGVTVAGQYWTMGRYDGVLIVSADNEKKVLHLLTELAALGNVRTETMQAFDDSEFDRIAK